MTKFILSAAVSAFTFLATPVLAQDAPAPAPTAPQTAAQTVLTQRADDIVAVLQGARDPAEVMSADFLVAVPPDKLTALVAQITGQFGPITGVESVEPTGDTSATIAIAFERGIGTGGFTIDTAAPFKVSGFRLTGFAARDDSYDKVAAEFAALPGNSGFMVARLGENGLDPIASHNPDTEFAVGSAFKLYVLSALVAQIDAGTRRWDDVVKIGPRSFPSGMTQDWPTGAPVTIQTLATLMISISDNTAADTLIRLVGRDAIADQIGKTGHGDPGRILPFLTTVEAFALKEDRAADKRAAYAAAAGDVEQGRLLDRWAADLSIDNVDIARLGGAAPRAIDSIEWFASPADIARVLDTLRRQNDATALAILGVAPHLGDAPRGGWDYVGYKGGSEPGVLNLSWLLRAEKGGSYVVTASWNDPHAALDNARLELLATRLVGLAQKTATGSN